MPSNKTAALADALLRPDVPLIHLPGEEPFRAVLAAPMRTEGRPFGVVGVVQLPEAGVDGRAVPPGRMAGRPVYPHPGDSAAANPSGAVAAIVESSDNAILSKDLNGIIRTWNAGAERLFGYRAEEVIGQPITLLLPPERIREEEEILERVRNGQHVEHLETVRVAKDGRRIDVSVTVSPVKGPTAKSSEFPRSSATSATASGPKTPCGASPSSPMRILIPCCGLIVRAPFSMLIRISPAYPASGSVKLAAPLPSRWRASSEKRWTKGRSIRSTWTAEAGSSPSFSRRSRKAAT